MDVSCSFYQAIDIGYLFNATLCLKVIYSRKVQKLLFLGLDHRIPNMDSDAGHNSAPSEVLPSETKILASAASLTQVPFH
jgi:hypothetical protein